MPESRPAYARGIRSDLEVFLRLRPTRHRDWHGYFRAERTEVSLRSGIMVSLASLRLTHSGCQWQAQAGRRGQLVSDSNQCSDSEVTCTVRVTDISAAGDIPTHWQESHGSRY